MGPSIYFARGTARAIDPKLHDRTHCLAGANGVLRLDCLEDGPVLPDRFGEAQRLVGRRRTRHHGDEGDLDQGDAAAAAQRRVPRLEEHHQPIP